MGESGGWCTESAAVMMWLALGGGGSGPFAPPAHAHGAHFKHIFSTLVLTSYMEKNDTGEGGYLMCLSWNMLARFKAQFWSITALQPCNFRGYRVWWPVRSGTPWWEVHLIQTVLFVHASYRPVVAPSLYEERVLYEERGGSGPLQKIFTPYYVHTVCKTAFRCKEYLYILLSKTATRNRILLLSDLSFAFIFLDVHGRS